MLTALPVAIFPFQCPGFPPAAWTPARLPAALHWTQKGKPWPFLFCQGPGVILVIHALSFILFGGESLLILRGNTIYRMFTPPKSLTLKMKPVPRVSLWSANSAGLADHVWWSGSAKERSAGRLYPLGVEEHQHGALTSSGGTVSAMGVDG